jgi:hypothetical protein
VKTIVLKLLRLIFSSKLSNIFKTLSCISPPALPYLITIDLQPIFKHPKLK